MARLGVPQKVRPWRVDGSCRQQVRSRRILGKEGRAACLPIPVPNSGFIKDLEYVGTPAGRRRYRNSGRDRIYEWDSLHGELEVYNNRGRHLGAVDAETGELIKSAVRGRRIDV
jgi:hypothetical protein